MLWPRIVARPVVCGGPLRKPLLPYFAGDQHAGVNIQADQDCCLFLQLCLSVCAVALIHVGRL